MEGENEGKRSVRRSVDDDDGPGGGGRLLWQEGEGSSKSTSVWYVGRSVGPSLTRLPARPFSCRNLPSFLLSFLASFVPSSVRPFLRPPWIGPRARRPAFPPGSLPRRPAWLEGWLVSGGLSERVGALARSSVELSSPREELLLLPPLLLSLPRTGGRETKERSTDRPTDRPHGQQIDRQTYRLTERGPDRPLFSWGCNRTRCLLPSCTPLTQSFAQTHSDSDDSGDD